MKKRYVKKNCQAKFVFNTLEGKEVCSENTTTYPRPIKFIAIDEKDTTTKFFLKTAIGDSTIEFISVLFEIRKLCDQFI